MTAPVVRHVSFKEANTRDDQRLWGRRFRQRCSCGWSAPGWFVHDVHGGQAWAEHVREAKAEEERG